MTLGDIVLGLCILFCLFVGICALLLCVAGFSFGQGVAITLAFLFLAVLIWCTFGRRAQAKRAMRERQALYAILEQPSAWRPGFGLETIELIGDRQSCITEPVRIVRLSEPIYGS